MARLPCDPDDDLTYSLCFQNFDCATFILANFMGFGVSVRHTCQCDLEDFILKRFPGCLRMLKTNRECICSYTVKNIRRPAAFSGVDRGEMEQRPRVGSRPEPKLETEDLLLDIRKVVVGEEEQLEWSSRVEQEQPEPPHIKEEQEELWTSQEGEQLQGLEEADISKLPFPPVPVKSEDDEEKPQSSQLHQSPAEESREVEPLSSSSTHHLKTEADGDHCGGPEPASNLDPDTLLHPDTDDATSDSSETEADHTGGKPYSCSVCGKECARKTDLNKHMRVHTGEKPFCCSVCNKRFPCKENLVRHMRFHSGEKPFSCSFCNKHFTRSDHAVKHRRIHTGEKPFSCSVCNSSFTQRHMLVEHMRTHTGVKPFICSVCNKCFHRKDSLKKHMKVHTEEKPFCCSHCSKSFRQRSDLVVHMRIHTGEKPFSCSTCNTSFTQRHTLVQHMRTHTGEKPFICSICGKRFSRKEHMTTHMAAHPVWRSRPAAVFVMKDSLGGHSAAENCK